MKQHSSYFTAFVCVLLGLTTTACTDEATTPDRLTPATARIETRAMTDDGTPVALSAYRLYGYQGNGSAQRFDAAFQPGKPVDITDVATLVVAAIQGEGKSYQFPDDQTALNASVIICPVQTDGQTLDIPLPALFLKKAAITSNDQQITLQLECLTSQLRVRATDTDGLATALVLTVEDMPRSIRLDDGSATGTNARLSLPLTLSNSSFSGGVNCLPPAATPTFQYKVTLTDGNTTTGTFTAGSFERGKAYTLNLALRDNRIHLETVTVAPWTEDSLGDGNATETTP